MYHATAFSIIAILALALFAAREGFDARGERPDAALARQESASPESFEPISVGDGSEVEVFADERIQLFTYRPNDCAPAGALIVFHGVNRKARSARDKSRQIADAACLIVFAPLFDKARFPNWRYHRAGVVYRGRVTPQSDWTGPIVADLVRWARAHAGGAEAEVYLFGHSAGGQILSRIAAYAPPADVARIVVANPSLHVWPDLDIAAPNGFRGVFAPEEAERRLQDYLAAPVTIYLGSDDTGARYLVTSDPAMAQGRNRLERGLNVFEAARAAAAERGWAFGWRLKIAEGVGHSSRGMLTAPTALEALGLGTPGRAAPGS